MFLQKELLGRCGCTQTVRRCYGGLLRPCSGPRRPHKLLFWYFHWRWRSAGRRGFLWPLSSPSTTVESDRETTSRQLQPGASLQAPRWCLSLRRQNRTEKFRLLQSLQELFIVRRYEATQNEQGQSSQQLSVKLWKTAALSVSILVSGTELS